MHPKPKRYINKNYREFIKRQPCCVTGLQLTDSDTGEIQSDPHHFKSRGSGGSDLTMIPLIHKLHVECEQIGQNTFQEKHGIDFKEVQRQMLEKYIMEKE